MLFAFYYNVSFLKIPIMVGTSGKLILMAYKTTIQIGNTQLWADRSTLRLHLWDEECPQDGPLCTSSLYPLPGSGHFVPQPPPRPAWFLVFLTGFCCEAESVRQQGRKKEYDKSIWALKKYILQKQLLKK